MTEYALEVTNLHKTFKLPVEKAGKLKTAAVNALKGVRGYKEQRVLKGISFKVKKGEFFGIVGRNGSGKSTLLKIISQIYQPTKGTVKTTGKLVPFIELGVGFNPELTGRENVYLNGALFGFSNEELDGMYDEIVDFAELGEFMNQKLKNYSSGMQVRLAFSLAIRSKADILVLDEILAVGDEAFQRKCYSYFAQAKRAQKTVILVTHSMDIIQQFCTRAISIEDGLIVERGNPARVAQHYREINSGPNREVSNNDLENKDLAADIKLEDKPNALTFYMKAMPKINLKDVAFTFTIRSESGEMVYRFVTDEKLSTPLDLRVGHTTQLELTLQDIFPSGIFLATFAVKSRDRSKEYISLTDAVSFEVKRSNGIYWMPDEKFKIID